MRREMTKLGDYAHNQVDRTPHFAPPINLNQLTQSSPEPPPPGRFISRFGKGEERINVIQAPQTDVTCTMNKEKKGGYADARLGGLPASCPGGNAQPAVMGGSPKEPRANDLDISVSAFDFLFGPPVRPTGPETWCTKPLRGVLCNFFALFPLSPPYPLR